jgi:hypothetical protein
VESRGRGSSRHIDKESVEKMGKYQWNGMEWCETEFMKWDVMATKCQRIGERLSENFNVTRGPRWEVAKSWDWTLWSVRNMWV